MRTTSRFAPGVPQLLAPPLLRFWHTGQALLCESILSLTSLESAVATHRCLILDVMICFQPEQNCTTSEYRYCMVTQNLYQVRAAADQGLTRQAPLPVTAGIWGPHSSGYSLVQPTQTLPSLLTQPRTLSETWTTQCHTSCQVTLLSVISYNSASGCHHDILHVL